MPLPHKPSGPSGYSQYLALGAQITASMLVPLVGGYLVDYYLGSDPWGFLSGMAVGFLSVFSVIYKVALRASGPKKNKSGDEEKRS